MIKIYKRYPTGSHLVTDYGKTLKFLPMYHFSSSGDTTDEAIDTLEANLRKALSELEGGALEVKKCLREVKEFRHKIKLGGNGVSDNSGL